MSFLSHTYHVAAKCGHPVPDQLPPNPDGMPVCVCCQEAPAKRNMALLRPTADPHGMCFGCWWAQPPNEHFTRLRQKHND